LTSFPNAPKAKVVLEPECAGVASGAEPVSDIEAKITGIIAKLDKLRSKRSAPTHKVLSILANARRLQQA
jgi:hypothetical protein